MTTPNPVVSRLSAVPRFGWIILGGLLIVALLATAAFFLLPELLNPFTTLNGSNSLYNHPDGLSIQLTDPAQTAKVRAETTPREVFVQGGGKWSEAFASVPTNLTPLSPIYEIDVREGAVTAEMAIPNGAQPLSLLDLYSWDAATKAWKFVPSRQKPDGSGITFEPQGEMAVMAVHVTPHISTAAIVQTMGGADLGADYDLVIAEGWHINETGQVQGGAALSTAANVLPMAQNRLGGFQYDLPDQRAIFTESLMTLISPYSGLVLDFAPSPLYVDFVSSLAERVHSHGKELHIVVRGSPDDYDLVGLDQYADYFWYAPEANPTVYLPDGTVGPALAAMVQRVDRNHMGLLVSGLNIDLANGVAVPISTDEALALFGNVEVSGEFDPAVPVTPGSTLPVRLTGQVTSMGYDEALGANYLTYVDAGQAQHHVYFGSALNLQHKLDWAKQFGLAAVAVHGIAHPSAPAGLAEGYAAFRQDQQSAAPTALQIIWSVQYQTGESLDSQTGDLNLIQYLWQAVTNPGAYTIRAEVEGAESSTSRGEVAVQVADAPTATITPTPTATVPGRPSVTPGPSPTPNPNATPKPAATAAPVSGSVAAGSFEFGGQTQTFAHADLMHQSGMTWVKFQHKWNPGDDPSGSVGGRIAEARAKGFKVLLSIPGPLYPTSINYEAYTQFLAGVAALGPDAIEVWNEMNFDREWPDDQINGSSYVTNMLKPAYEAIKGANPAVMVISGAPTPTGAFGGGCGALTFGSNTVSGCDDWVYIKQMSDAGARNYMDCVGVHYNEGIISPNQRTGDPRDAFYSRYFFGMLDLYYNTFSKPLCFTELGYLSPEGYGALPADFNWAHDTTAQEQAQWLAEAAVLSSQSGKVRLMIIFNVDFTTFGSDPQAAYAMVRPDGTCPACTALDAVTP